jgi:hypothetical protein
MTRTPGIKRFAALCAAVFVLAACASQREPAQKMMSDIEAAVSAASADAAKYIPDQLIDVQTKLDDLKTSLNAQDYKRVLAQGPALLAEAQALEGAAAAKKAEVMKDLNDQWAALSGSLPNLAMAIQSRIDFLSQKKNKKLAAGIDLDAAKATLSDATSGWSKAQGAFGNGNMSEAVTAAKDVKTKLDGLAALLKMDAAGTQPASRGSG